MTHHPLRDLVQAFGLMTVLPVGDDWVEGPRRDTVGFYPVVGWALGLAGVGIAGFLLLLGADAEQDALLMGALIVGGWALLTRFLHWDGLADAADGLLGSLDRERRLEIMRDSHVGAFGATAIVLVALAQAAAVGSLIASGTLWPLLAAPVFGRSAAALACWTLPAARREGLALSAVQRASAYARAVAALALSAAVSTAVLEAYLAGTAGPWCPASVLGVILISAVASVAVPRLLARGVGGVTGDILGASVLLVEVVVLAAAALAV